MGLEQFSSVHGLVINVCINDQGILQVYSLFGRPASLDDITVVCVSTKGGHMTPLIKFQFQTIKRKSSGDPIHNRRSKLIQAIEEQKQVLEKHQQGDIHTVRRDKWMRNELGEDVLVQRQKRVRPWFFEQGGVYYLQVRYGARVIAVDGKNNAISVRSLDELLPIYDTLIEVAKAGALDDAIEQALVRKPKYKPGAAKTAELHKIKP